MTFSPSGDPAKLPEKVVILGEVSDEDSESFELIYFVREGDPYIPLFSSKEEFERETAGSDYMHQGIEIDTRLLGALLEADYPIILDPLSSQMRLVDKAELLGIRP